MIFFNVNYTISSQFVLYNINILNAFLNSHHNKINWWTLFAPNKLEYSSKNFS